MADVTLWAEDERLDRHLIESTLKGLVAKPEVHFVEDGFELLEAIDKARPARVVLDLKMPRMSGQDVLKRLRTDPALLDLPISVFTGLSNPRVEAQCRDLGVNSYVCKPLDLQAYAAGVCKVLCISTNVML